MNDLIGGVGWSWLSDKMRGRRHDEPTNLPRNTHGVFGAANLIGGTELDCTKVARTGTLNNLMYNSSLLNVEGNI